MSVKKRSIKIAGHATSLTLETPFWICLKEIAKQKKQSINALVEAIDQERDLTEGDNLSSAVRVYILNYYRKKKYD